VDGGTEKTTYTVMIRKRLEITDSSEKEKK
jgi:hypothetical protein